MHRRFAEPGSDFLTFVTLWDYLRTQQRELSGSAFRRMCRREYLHYLRVREWQDIYGQLRQAAREFGVVVGREAEPKHSDRDRPERKQPDVGWQRAAEEEPRYPADLADRVHQSLLAGLLSHLGMQAVPAGRPGESGPGERRGAGQGAGRSSSPAPAARSSRFSRTHRWPGSRRRG